MARDQNTSNRQPDHHPTESLAAYALGAIDTDEHAAVETHLAGCESCRAELARQEELVGALGFGARPVSPSPDLRASIFSEVRQGNLTKPAPRRYTFTRIALAAAALIAIASIVILAALLSRAIDERDDARWGEQRMAGYLADGGTLSPLLPAPDAPAGVTTGNGSLAIAPSDDKAMLVVYDLQPSSDGWRYSAWAERDGHRIRLGTVEVDDRGVGWLVFYPPEPMSDYDIVGINRAMPSADDSEPFLVATVNS